MPDHGYTSPGACFVHRWPSVLVAALAAWALLCLLPFFSSASAPAAQPDPASPSPVEGLDAITGPVLETTIVGLNLRGERHRDRLQVPDLDILVLEDGSQLVPLLRILRILQTQIDESGPSVVFQAEGGPEAAVHYGDGTVTTGSISQPVRMQVGLSDITERPEIYIPVEILAELLAVDIRWDEPGYEFQFYTNQRLRIFEQFYRPTPSLLRMASGYAAGFDLPGNLPPAKVGRLAAPDLNFAEVRLETRILGLDPRSGTSEQFSTPQLKLWGQVLGGNLVSSISQRRLGPDRGIRADHLSWTTWFDHTELSAGDNHFGVSELAFPSVDMFGVRVNGLVGPMLEQRGAVRARTGWQETFLPSHVFEGYAPLESDVTLFINGQEVGSQVVEPGEGAPPGMGLYRFEGLNLLSRQLNDIRVVTETPDGGIEETHREILGTDLLVPRGNLAYLGGVGTGRTSVHDRRAQEGFFAGGRLLYGLTRNLTVGFSGATQRHFYSEGMPRLAYYGEDISWLPTRSVHLSSRLIWQPLGPLLITSEAARSQDPTGECSDGAYKISGDLQFRSTNIRPMAFWYGPRFFEGRNVGLRDRAGGRLRVSRRLGDGSHLTVGGIHLRDNLDHSRAETALLTIGQIQWDVRNVIPKSALTIGYNQFWSESERALRSYAIGFDSTLLPGWILRTHYQFGDDLRERRREDVLRDLRTGYFGVIGPLFSQVDLARRLGRNWRLGLAHRSSFNFNRSFLDVSHRRLGGRAWQWRVSLGYDWYNERYFADNRVEFALDRTQRNRIGLSNRVYRGDWSLNVSLQLDGLFGFVNHRPFWIQDPHLNPDLGGVKGKVFLDFNANGLLDSDEPGLEDVEVMSTSGRRTSSGKSGEYFIPSTSRGDQVRVSLEPETLPAIYTPTQATQEAVIRPGMFTSVNLGVAAFGSISGRLQAPSAQGTLRGVRAVRILLVDQNGSVVSHSVTGRDGAYYLGEVKPGRYSVMIDSQSLPPDLEIDVVAREVEVLSGEEPFEIEDLSFLGDYATPPPEEEPETPRDVEYRVFD